MSETEETKEKPAKQAEVAQVDSGKEKNKPQFSLKMKGNEGFVGNGWLNQSQYGKYVSIKVRQNVAAGTTLYLSPTRENPNIL